MESTKLVELNLSKPASIPVEIAEIAVVESLNLNKLEENAIIQPTIPVNQ